MVRPGLASLWGYQNRQYTTSTDSSEWAMVEMYMVQCQPRTIPVPQQEKDYSSGFVMPTAKPGDFPFFVKRAPSWLFPVYVSHSLKLVLFG